MHWIKRDTYLQGYYWKVVLTSEKWIDTGATIHHDGYSSDSAYRGNVTKIGRMLNVSATTINSTDADVTDYNYDIAGNLVSATLSCCQLPTDQLGQFNTHVIVLQPVAVTIDRSPDGNVTNLSIGSGEGLGYFNFRTNTGVVRSALVHAPGGCLRAPGH